jgi:8-oxo-dGTP pyrophosphatase MutT (NUDIX family)
MKTYVIVNAVVQYKNKYLIGKRAPTKRFAPNVWEFITGFIGDKESAEDCILRELEEETRLKGKIIKSGLPYYAKDMGDFWVIIPFMIEADDNRAVISLKNHSELKWVSKEGLLEYPDLSNDIKEMKIRGLI